MMAVAGSRPRGNNPAKLLNGLWGVRAAPRDSRCNHEAGRSEDEARRAADNAEQAGLDREHPLGVPPAPIARMTPISLVRSSVAMSMVFTTTSELTRIASRPMPASTAPRVR